MEEEISESAREEKSSDSVTEDDSSELVTTLEKSLDFPVEGNSETSKKDSPLFVRDIVPPVLHLIVVGFHHKKGCQVEYSYPPLNPSSTTDSHECPEIWKNLSSLAMPDGSHNFVEDTVYFHLPSITEPGKTVYGVSSYRQIEAKVLQVLVHFRNSF